MSFNVMNKVHNAPWAITADMLKTISEVVSENKKNFNALQVELGEKLPKTQGVTVRDGVAILSIHGPVFKFANLFTKICGGATYDIMMRDFNKAVNDPNVKAIILDIDSPGGEVNGLSEFANAIYHARDMKPIYAYGGGTVASAAYWIASAAHKIIASESAVIGSIGVVATYRKNDDDNEVEIVSSQSPKKRPDLNTEDGVNAIRENLDDLADLFIKTVARNRGVEVDKVLSDFGQGGVMIGEKAVNAGLADEIGGFEALLKELTSKTEEDHQDGGFFNANKEEHEAMDLKTLKAEHGDLVDAIKAETKVEIEAESQDAVKADRERIKEIMALEEAEGREPLAQSFAFSGMSVEEAKGHLSNSPKAEAKEEVTNPLAKAMEKEENVEVEASDEEKVEGSNDAYIDNLLKQSV